MFRPAIQKTRVLVSLALMNLLLFAWAQNSKGIVNAPGYNFKIQASELMRDAMNVLKEVRYGKNPTFLDAVNDPNETGLVGPKFSHISTGEGDLDSKLTTLNPNFAAGMVELFMQANLSEGDKVAIALTGSMPGANLAVLSACKVMEIHPVIISSVGSSHWGATDPDFTWVDIEKILVENGVLTHKSVAASIGGKSDIGGGMSLIGREQIVNAIFRSEVPNFIESDFLSESINTRLKIYSSKLPLNEYSAYINVGGGAASIGNLAQAGEIKAGVSYPRDLKMMNKGNVLMKFSEAGIPVIHILNIRELCDSFGLEFAPVPFPPIGKGGLYSMEAYNFPITLTALFIAVGSLIGVSIHSHNQIVHQRDSYEPESIL